MRYVNELLSICLAKLYLFILYPPPHIVPSLFLSPSFFNRFILRNMHVYVRRYHLVVFLLNVSFQSNRQIVLLFTFVIIILRFALYFFGSLSKVSFLFNCAYLLFIQLKQLLSFCFSSVCLFVCMILAMFWISFAKIKQIRATGFDSVINHMLNDFWFAVLLTYIRLIENIQTKAEGFHSLTFLNKHTLLTFNLITISLY